MAEIDQTRIGPLTAEEWCSLRLGVDDDPFQCCGDTSDLRDAAFHALRMGGEEWNGTEFHRAWIRVGESHPDHGLVTHPAVAKLYDFYIKDKPVPPSDEELDAFVADQRMQLQRAVVRQVFERANEFFGGDVDEALDGTLAEYADKAAGSFRRENEALTSALRAVLGFEATPVGTEIVDQMRAERAAETEVSER
jgi:hypothetical protein